MQHQHPNNGGPLFTIPKMTSPDDLVELFDEQHAQQWRTKMLDAFPQKRKAVPDGLMIDAKSRTFVLHEGNTEIAYIRIIDVTNDVPPLPRLPNIWMVSETYVLPRWQRNGAAMIKLMRYVLDHADTHIVQFTPTSEKDKGFMALCGYDVFVAQPNGRKRALSPTYAIESGAIKFK